MDGPDRSSQDRLTIASLNTRGIPLIGSQLRERYAAIGRAFEESSVDVVCFQEVLTYYHLRQLTRHMPSYSFVSYRPSVVGPAGGLLTTSRGTIGSFDYQRFPTPPAATAVGLPRLSRLKASLKGVLFTRLAKSRVQVVNTHLLANPDGDWSDGSRFYGLQQEQLAALGHLVGGISGPAVVCGDFNVARDSTLFRDFMSNTGFVDAFDDHCPPTFHVEYLGPGRSSQCIDFILLAGPSIKAESAELMFTDRLPMSSGAAYVSDHVGLKALVAA